MLGNELKTAQIIGILFLVACGDVTETNPDAAADGTVDPVDAAADGTVDAIDGPRANLQFELVYVSDISVTAGLFTAAHVGVVVNRGSVALDLNEARVVSAMDDHPQATFEMTVVPSKTALASNNAAGDLSPAAKALILDSGEVKETWSDMEYSMNIALRNMPDGEYKVTASATLELDGVQIEIPFAFGHGTTISFNGINRALSTSREQP